MLQPKKLSSQKVELINGISLVDVLFWLFFILLDISLFLIKYFGQIDSISWWKFLFWTQPLIVIGSLTLFFLKKESTRFYLYLYRILIFRTKKKEFSYENKQSDN